MSRSTARGLLLAGVVIWGWTFVATKICLDYMTPLELLGLRLLIALPVLAVLVGLRRRRLALGPRPWRLLPGSVVIGVHFYVQITGLQYTTATNTGWIIAITPLVIALLAAAVLGEPARGRLWLGIVVATAGILLLVSRGRVHGLGWLGSPGDWLVLISAHTWALYTIAVRPLLRRGDPLVVTLAVLVPPTVVVLGLMLATSDWARWLELPLEPLLALLFLGVFGMALAQWFWQEGVAEVGAAEAGLFLYLEPLATMALAVPYLGEPVGPFTLAGGLLVLLGVWLGQRRARARR